MKALTVGSAMVDTIAIIESSRIERMAMRNADTSYLLLEEGRKIDAHEISTHCGGGAVNAAISMARLGCDVASLVKLGQDGRAELVLRRLEEEGVSTRFVVRDRSAPTGASVLVSSHDRNAAIFTFRGANGLMEPEDLREQAFDVDLVHISALSNRSAERFPEIVSRARARRALVSCNPGVRQLSARFEELRAVLASIDIISLNRSEADILVPFLVGASGEGGAPLEGQDGEPPPALAIRGLIGGGYEVALANYLRALCALGPRLVVLTDGSRGAFVATCGEILFCPALPAHVVGTAGAGDAFASTFAVSIASGSTAEEAVLAASVNATGVLRFVDAQSGLLRRPEMEKRIAEARKAVRISRWPNEG